MLNLKWRITARSGDDPGSSAPGATYSRRYPQQAKALIERWMPETERYRMRKKRR